MKEEESTYAHIFTKTVLIVILSILIFGAGFLMFKSTMTDSSCKEIKQVIYFEEVEYEIADYVSDIYEYYGLASSYYDVSDYDSVIYYCEKSRKQSQIYSQKLREIKAEYPNNPIEILEVRKDMIEVEIDYLFALYESCEYLESAVRAYDGMNWEMGDSNIEGQNTAIRIHDNLLEDYYNLEAKYNKLKRELVE